MSFRDGGQPDREAQRRRSHSRHSRPDGTPRTGTDRPVLARPRNLRRGHPLPGPDPDRAAADDGLPQRRASRSTSGINREDGLRAGLVLRYDGGIRDFVEHVNGVQGSPVRVRSATSPYEEEGDQRGGRDSPSSWNTGFNRPMGIHSFANGITTGEGGMHEAGLPQVAHQCTVNRYAFEGERATSRTADDDRLQGEDIREGMTAIISGATPSSPSSRVRPRAKLGNVSVRSMVERATNEKLAGVVRGEPRSEAKLVVNKATVAAQRARIAARPRLVQSNPPQVGARRRRPARQAHRLRLRARIPSECGALHRRGQLGRRLGQGGPRSAHDGDPADPRARS